LLAVLGSGIAFHNSDLSPEEREIVERHFRGGAIRALFSTSTLAVGMNLPVKNVVLDHQRWEYLRRYGRWSLQEISRSEYENMSGRAGRLSLVEDFGRSILVTYSPFEADVWLQHFAGGEFGEIRPTLADAPLENHVLDLMASGLASSRTELEEMLLSSFTGWAHWAQKISRAEFSEALTKAVACGIGGGLLRALEGDQLEVTAVGRVCATKGIGVATGAALAKWATEAIGSTLHDLEVLLTVSLTPAGSDIYLALAGDERWRADYRGELLARVASAGATSRPVFARLATDLQSLEYDATKAIKKTLLMADWIAEVRTQDLENRYHIWAGAVRRTGEELGWLVDALAGVARASGWPDVRSRALGLLADRLMYGVIPDALPLAQLRARGVGRALLRRLVDGGFADPDALRTAGREAVAGVMKHKAAMTSLWAVVQRASPAAITLAASPSGAGFAEATPEKAPSGPALVVDLTAQRVTYRGHAIPTKPPHHLQRQSVLALAVLAARAGTIVTMTDLADEMKKVGRLNRRLVTPEPREIRYRVIRPFRRALAGVVAETEIEGLVENVPGAGLRLNAAGGARVVNSTSTRSSMSSS
jgi:helicase